MTGLTRRWFAFVEVDDRAGASSALTGVFSERGVSFGSISTLDVHDGRGTVCVEFAASERLAQVLVRTLERLAVVRAVRMIRSDDAGVRAVAVLAECDATHSGDTVTVHRHDAGGSAITMLAGPLVDVTAEVARQRAAGATVESITVLPPH